MFRANNSARYFLKLKGFKYILSSIPVPPGHLRAGGHRAHLRAPPRLPDEDLPGAAQGGGLPLLRGDQHAVREHPGDLPVPEAVPLQPRGGRRLRAAVPQAGHHAPVQGL